MNKILEIKVLETYRTSETYHTVKPDRPFKRNKALGKLGLLAIFGGLCGYLGDTYDLQNPLGRIELQSPLASDPLRLQKPWKGKLQDVYKEEAAYSCEADGMRFEYVNMGPFGVKGPLLMSGRYAFDLKRRPDGDIVDMKKYDTLNPRDRARFAEGEE